MSEEVVARTYPIPASMIGAVIGKQGKTAEWMRRNTEAEIWIDDKTGNENLGHKWCHVRVRGTPQQHYNCVKMIWSATLSVLQHDE